MIGRFYPDLFDTMIKTVSARLDQALADQPQLHVVWRPSGHIHFKGARWDEPGATCSKFGPQSNDSILLESQAISDHQRRGMFAAVHASLAMARSAVLDHDYLTRLRGEAHIERQRCFLTHVKDAEVANRISKCQNLNIDCMHYCLSGAPLAWNTLLQGILCGRQGHTFSFGALPEGCGSLTCPRNEWLPPSPPWSMHEQTAAQQAEESCPDPFH